MTEALVRAEGVSRRFRAGAEIVHALTAVDLEAYAGEFLAVVGRSGSGKTTLLNILGGLDRPDEGRVFLRELELSAMSEHDLTLLRRKEIGFIFQSFGLLPLLSAHENVELALRIAGAGYRQRGERTRELLELVGLGKRAHHRPFELSGGEQQRVAIARALANRPPLLIADEPTGELDSHTAGEIFALLQQVAREQGTCIVASTHDPAIREAADRVESLADGRLVRAGAASAAAMAAAAPAPFIAATEEPAVEEPPVEAPPEELFRRRAGDGGGGDLLTPNPFSPQGGQGETAAGDTSDQSRWARP